MSFRVVSAYSGRSGGDQEKPSTGRSHTGRSPTSKLLVPPRPPWPPHTLQPLHSLKTSPAAARQNAAKSRSTPHVVNIDETSCRLLPVHQIGWGRRGFKQAQLQGNTREATTFTVAFSMDRGPQDSLVQHTRAGQTPSCRSSPGRGALTTTRPRTAGPRRRRSCSSRPPLDDVLNPSREGQSWILLLWDMANIHASEATMTATKATFPHVVLCLIPPRKLRTGTPAIWRLPQLQELHPDAGERHSCPLRHRRLVRRLGHEQGMAAPVFGRIGGSRTHGPLRHKPGVDDWLASLARPHRRRIPRGRRRGQRAARHWRVVRETDQSPLPKTPWTRPWQRRQTTKTTRPCSLEWYTTLRLVPWGPK